ARSSLQFLLRRGREERVIEDQPVAWRVGVQGQIGRSVADLVLRVFRIVPSKESPGALPVLAMDVLHPWRARLIGQNGHAGLESLAGEGGGKSIKIRNDLSVILHQHRRNWIDLGAEVE